VVEHFSWHLPYWEQHCRPAGQPGRRGRGPRRWPHTLWPSPQPSAARVTRTARRKSARPARQGARPAPPPAPPQECACSSSWVVWRWDVQGVSRRAEPWGRRGGHRMLCGQSGDECVQPAGRPPSAAPPLPPPPPLRGVHVAAAGWCGGGVCRECPRGRVPGEAAPGAVLGWPPGRPKITGCPHLGCRAHGDACTALPALRGCLHAALRPRQVATAASVRKRSSGEQDAERQPDSAAKHLAW
jgi:hypothetical protein